MAGFVFDYFAMLLSSGQMTTLNTRLAIKAMSLRNRLVLAPITTNFGSSGRRVTQDVFDVTVIAQGGWKG
ncbi:MAG: hypothetical protein KKE44_19300 [Proteobacteria bacterium]|nr:hypothetical protein [Pseudomonadota bacterium]MBU1584881.1 hypothetical protein [Pseudomonadota bacterium]MBU2456160.1 hypothetical protein [Pseudomonadota bacterium]MBU2627204.1 hypothetical protein [Pseudomonadota bacterium]